MDLVHFINSFITVESAIGLWVVGMVAIWFRPSGWHERVEAWQDLHSLGARAAAASYDARDPLEWNDPDTLLPFPMEEE